MFCSSTVLPVRGCATIRARWPLPSGDTMSITRGERSLIGRVLDLHLHPLGRIERRQVVEVHLVALLLGVLEVDRVDLEQREVALALLGAADLALDRIAGPQREAPDLRGRDVDVVGARQVVGVGRAQEAEAVLQHLDHAGADDVGVLGGQLLEDGEHQLLLAHGAGVLDADLLGEAQQLRRRLDLEVLELHLLDNVLHKKLSGWAARAWEVGRVRLRGAGRKEGCRMAFRICHGPRGAQVWRYGKATPARLCSAAGGDDQLYSRLRGKSKSLRRVLLQSWRQAPSRSTPLERLHDHQDHDADHQQRRHLVGDADRTAGAARCGPRRSPCARRPSAWWIDRSAAHQRELGPQPAVVDACPAPRPASGPVTHTTIIAGFMMKRSRRCSITLKVSDCLEPFSAVAVIDEQPRQIEQPRHPRDDGDHVQRLQPKQHAQSYRGLVPGIATLTAFRSARARSVPQAAPRAPAASPARCRGRG